MNQIISNFQADGTDLLVGVATPVAMAMQAATEGTQTPVVFAAVWDPMSVDLVDSLDAPGQQHHGVRLSRYHRHYGPDLCPEPGDEKVGLLYDVGQDSSATAIADAKKNLSDRGVEVIERTGTTVDEIALAAQALVADSMDAVFSARRTTLS
ncbi:MAG: ABC transporter substrate binding protein [Oscillospiraceae bacterium]